MFSDLNLYNSLNTKDSFCFNWFKINYNIECYDIFSCYELQKKNNMSGNNLMFKTNKKTFPDAMIEHTFERFVFLIVKFFKLDINILSKKNKVKEFEEILNNKYINYK